MKQRLSFRARNVPKMLYTVGLLAVFTSSFARAAIIPSNTVIDWAHTQIGVPGGIPSRTTIYTNLYPGVQANDISAAIAACQPNAVVYLNAGTYNLTNSIVFPSNRNFVSLRGAGSLTVLNFIDPASPKWSPGGIYMGTSLWPRPAAKSAITSGATNGSTMVTVADASNIYTGMLIRIEQWDIPGLVFTNLINIGTTYSNRMSFMFLCTGLTSNTVSFTPALPYTLTNHPSLASTVVTGQQYIIQGDAVENLVIEMTNAPTSAAGLYMQQAQGCWLSNVEVRQSMHRFIELIGVIQSEVQHCYIHDAGYGGGNGEALDLVVDDCWNLIDNNTVLHTDGLWLNDFQGGCSGNIISYNYCYNSYTGSSVYWPDIFLSHGAHSMFNLVEGNVSGGVKADGYYGSASHDTVYRNWLTCDSDIYNLTNYGGSGLTAVDLCHWEYNFNIVGNILGNTNYPPNVYSMENSNYSYSVSTVYRLGYPYMGQNCIGAAICYQSTKADVAYCTTYDPQVAATLFRHGNYDYATGGIVWSNGYSQTLSNSLYLTSKPSWWGSLPWPPFDPNNPSAANVTNIPAGYRYTYRVDPAAETKVFKIFQVR